MNKIGQRLYGISVNILTVAVNFVRDKDLFLGCVTFYLNTLSWKWEHTASDKIADDTKLFEVAKTKRNREEPEWDLSK